MAESLAQHAGIRRLHAVRYAVDVHVINAVPILDLVVPNLAQNADAGVVKQVIQTPVCFDGGFDKPIDCLKLSDIQFSCSRFPTVFPDASCHLVSKINLQIGKYDGGSSSGQIFTQGTANP